ncbi:hypothetical protein M422DRAFT_22775 [Sphaerobolus stellatus SS14]|nr:hypothetical protein M422DRAFT_22775 [Sphaerobolus stellatus SS14]
MANYHRYQESLTSAGRGTPLWEPSSTSDPLRIGDVGYLSFGTFIRLFNATLPVGHPENHLGEPRSYTSMKINPAHVRRSVLPGGIIASSGVQLASKGGTDSASSSSLTFKCTDKVGAVLITEQDIIAEDLVDPGLFATYISKFAQSWLDFANNDLGRDVALHELILVTGYDQTRGRFSSTVFDGARNSKLFGRQASFQVADPVCKSSDWSNPNAIDYFHHNYGPARLRNTPPSTLFIRGFKIMNRELDGLESDEEEYLEVDGMSHYLGPLDAVLRYLTEKSNAPIVITHDRDLHRLSKKEKTHWSYKHVLKLLEKGHYPFVAGPIASLV